MKKIMLFAILVAGTLLGVVKANGNSSDELIIYPASIQTPFTFMNAVPDKVRINDGINLSFFVNQSIVFQYRYKLQAPKEAAKSLGSGIINWSGWINNDIVELDMPKLSKPGKYKFTIEYRTHSGTQVGLFEKTFEVLQEEVKKYPQQTTAVATKNTVAEPLAVTTAVAVVNQPDTPKPEPLNKTADTGPPVLYKTVPDTVLFPTGEEKKSETHDQTAQPSTDKKITQEEITIKDYDKLLIKAIESHDINLFRESLQNGANTKIAGENGGNIFHLMTGKIEEEEFVNQIKEAGNSIDKTDNFGNTPLHYSILSGRTIYALNLLSNGANINLMNESGLAPLHLAACVNNLTLVKELIKSGADVNIQGNTDYTPLHIASELNNPEIVRLLLANKASLKIETGQKLDALEIAKIQKNEELEKLIKSKGRYLYNPVQPYTLLSVNSAQEGNYPDIDFTLPYDENLVRRRNADKLIQWIAVPFLAVGVASSVYFSLEAEDNYNKYKNAESMEEAQIYYDKTKQYDTYTMISVCVSVIPLYGLIHSTINRINVTKRMGKSF